VKLWEKIESIDFSDAEKDRIGRSLRDSQSTQARVLNTKGRAIRDPDFWRGAQKKFRVNGFRDGAPGAINKIVSLALAAAANNSSERPHGNWQLIWPLYQRSVYLNLEQEMPGLHELLQREDYQPGSGSETEQIFRCVAKCLPLHAATLDQVREFYNLWGFERTEYIEEILSSVRVDAEAVRRMVDDGVRTMRREISSSLASARTDIQRRIEQHSMELATLKGMVKSQRDDLVEARGEMRDSVATLKAVPSAMHVATTGGRRGESPQEPEGKHAARDSAAVNAMQTRVDNFGRQMKELRTRIDELEGGERPRSERSAAGAAQLSMTTASQVITKWRDAFSEAGVPSGSIGACWILLEIVRRSRVILTNRPELIVSLMGAVPGGQIRRLVASPLWLTESDWKDGLTFVTELVDAPRVLIVEDFDVALQETYLVPSLIAWMSGATSTCASRVVLVPSGSELASVSPRVLELATLLTDAVPFIRDLKRLGATISDSPPTLEYPQSGAGVLSYQRSKNVASEEELRRYAKNYGVALPPRLVQSFVSLDEGLQAFLSVRDARGVAQEATLMPWIERARGENLARIFREAMQVLSGT
jgi:hypothetical protein